MPELPISIPFIVVGALAFGVAIGTNLRGAQRRQQVGSILTVLLLLGWGLSTAYAHLWAVPLSVAAALITAWSLAVADLRDHPQLHGESFAKKIILILVHETKLRRTRSVKLRDAESVQVKTDSVDSSFP